jgi:hypothetical protein
VPFPLETGASGDSRNVGIGEPFDVLGRRRGRTMTQFGQEGYAGRGSPVPAYGPVDAVLGYVVFYVFVDRATPTVVDVLTTAIPDLTPSLVRLGLAMVLWFVLAAILLDQTRRQLAALGLGSRSDVRRARRRRAAPSNLQFVGYLLVVLVGGTVAAWTFEPAVRAGIAVVRVVATLDVVAFAPLDLVTIAVFFVAFSGATHALDRVVIGSIRRLWTV